MMTVAVDIIALEKSALNRWCAGNPDGFLDVSADGVTDFDPFREARLDGRAALATLYDELRGKVYAPRHDVIEPMVQVAGDAAAVLTLHFVSWNGMEVYRRTAEDAGSSRRTGHALLPASPQESRTPGREDPPSFEPGQRPVS